jgi:uncharacterized membrane protein YcaP (DUF421 family)
LATLEEDGSISIVMSRFRPGDIMAPEPIPSSWLDMPRVVPMRT